MTGDMLSKELGQFLVLNDNVQWFICMPLHVKALDIPIIIGLQTGH